MRLTPPSTKRQLRRFLGMINYYRDMWRRRSHILAPLTAMCSAKAKFIWHDKEQKAFEDIKAIISRETLLAYPDFSKAEELPWSLVNVDLIGPYVVRTPTSTHTLRALTMIDPVTGWFKVISIPDKNAHTVMEAFNNTWLTRYPRPQYIGYDNGSEFKAQFKQMCENYGMKEKPSSSYNP